MVLFILFYLILLVKYIHTQEVDGLDLCLENCVSSERLFGPTRPSNTRAHPFKITPFPSTTTSFCQLGCQIFFSSSTNITCSDTCDKNYRYQVTTGYSDIAEVARLECRDGCNIALNVCQAGFYCGDGSMKLCPEGTYREAVTNVSIAALSATARCTDCPHGRYRATKKGKSANDCKKCPINTYADKTGSTSDANCLRCPAGKFAAEEGSKVCSCITADSCSLTVDVGGHNEVFYENDVDYDRETVPYIGRW